MTSSQPTFNIPVPVSVSSPSSPGRKPRRINQNNNGSNTSSNKDSISKAKLEKSSLALLLNKLPEDDPDITSLELLNSNRKIIHQGLLQRQSDSWRDSDNQLHTYLLDNALLLLELAPQKKKEDGQIKKKFRFYKPPISVSALSAISGGQLRVTTTSKILQRFKRIIALLSGKVTRSSNYIQAPSTPSLEKTKSPSISANTTSINNLPCALGYPITFTIKDLTTNQIAYQQVLFAPSVAIRNSWLDAIASVATSPKIENDSVVEDKQIQNSANPVEEKPNGLLSPKVK